MEQLKRFEHIDYDSFKMAIPLEAKYGLPEEVKFCKKCVISNQRPSSVVETKNNQKEKYNIKKQTEYHQKNIYSFLKEYPIT